jgi:hypothetical protein
LHIPRTASWATFSRPCGTEFKNLGSSQADSEALTYATNPLGL